MRRKSPLTFDSEFFSVILCVSCKKLVNEFEEIGNCMAKFCATFTKKLLNSSISFINLV